MDPLAQLNDIHLPDQVSHYPIAAGWWALYALLLSLLLFSVYKFVKFRQKKRAQKQASNYLKHCQDASEIIRILKWVTMQYYPRAEVASLSGDNLQQFLISQLKDKYRKEFQSSSGELLTAVYQRTLHKKEIGQLKTSVQFWLSHALPPKLSSKALHKEAI